MKHMVNAKNFIGGIVPEEWNLIPSILLQIDKQHTYVIVSLSLRFLCFGVGYGVKCDRKRKPMKTALFLFAILLAIAAQGQSYSTWRDTNADGCADGWKCKAGQPALITTKAFRTNAQQVADPDHFNLVTAPVRQHGGKHVISFRYIASEPVTVSVWIDMETSLEVLHLEPTLTTTPASAEYWVPQQRMITFTGCGWLQLDDVQMYFLYGDEPERTDTVKRMKVSEWKEILQLNKVRK